MPFQPGQSGNPAGRPKGSSAQQQFRAELEKHGRLAMEKLVEKIEEGDTTAMKIWFDKVLPTLRQVDAEVDVRHSIDDLPLERLLARHDELLAQLKRLMPDDGASK